MKKKKAPVRKSIVISGNDLHELAGLLGLAAEHITARSILERAEVMKRSLADAADAELIRMKSPSWAPNRRVVLCGR